MISAGLQHTGVAVTVPYSDTISLSAVTSACVLVPRASQHKLNKTDLLPQQSGVFDESALRIGKVLTTSV